MSNIQNAFYGASGLREKCLADVCTHRDRIVNDVKSNAPFEVSPYFVAIFYRDMVHDVKVDRHVTNWAEALRTARSAVESRLRALSWVARSSTAEQAMKDQAEREACFKFLDATRDLSDD